MSRTKFAVAVGFALIGTGLWATVEGPGSPGRLLAEEAKAQDDAKSPDKQPRPVGAVVLIGGHEDKKGRMEILKEVVRLAGGSDARIVVVTAASDKPKEQADDYREAFGKLEVRDVRVLETPDREAVDSEENLAAIDRATCVFFTGGDQEQLIKTLRNTELDRRMHRRHLDGVVIAGTSAGASMQAEMMAEESGSESSPRAGMKLGYGMDFMPGVLVDQHFSQRGRTGRLLSALAERPQSIGVGIDENTAMIVTGGDHGEVIGEGVVTIIEASEMEYSNRKGREEGEALALFGLTLNTLPRGCHYDFRFRKATDSNDPKAVKRAGK
jgi:cyanophycinase